MGNTQKCYLEINDREFFKRKRNNPGTSVFRGMMGVVDLNKPSFSDIKEMKRKADVKGLIQALRRDESDLREAAAEVLGEIGGEKAVDALVSSSLNDIAEVREKAFISLVKIANDTRFASMKVAKHPEYLCSVDLPPERVEWPANCCICMRSPQVYKPTLCQGRKLVSLGPTYDQYSVFTRVARVPYCSNCFHKTEKRFFGEDEGVKIELIVRDSEVVRSKIKFRNPLYAKKFLEINS